MAANGFPPNMDPRFGMKAPYVGILAPPAAGAPPTIRTSPPPQTPEIRDRPVGGIFAGYSYAQGGPRNVPAFPSIMDMSSTKVHFLVYFRKSLLIRSVKIRADWSVGRKRWPRCHIASSVAKAANYYYRRWLIAAPEAAASCRRCCCCCCFCCGCAPRPETLFSVCLSVNLLTDAVNSCHRTT